MDKCTTPGAQELEYLAYIVERAAAVRTAAGLRQWSQGALQILLPHQAMVCLRFDGHGRQIQALCLHGAGMAGVETAPLCALAERLAGCREGLPVIWPHRPEGSHGGQVTPLWRDLAAAMPGAVLVHGTGELAGGSALFILFGMPSGRDAEYRYYMQLLLPSLYLALQRLAMPCPGARLAAPLDDPLTGRELEVLHWLRQGKINAEIGAALGISTRTVKNHVYNIYRKLDVQNRVQAVARAAALSLPLAGRAA